MTMLDLRIVVFLKIWSIQRKCRDSSSIPRLNFEVINIVPIHFSGNVWRHLITAANDNKDIKLWDCREWSLIQTLTLAIEGHPKLSLDASATILMASDQASQVRL